MLKPDKNISQHKRHREQPEYTTLAYVSAARELLIQRAAIIGSISDERGETTVEER